jgi:hypothetical protein
VTKEVRHGRRVVQRTGGHRASIEITSIAAGAELDR